MTSRNWRRPRAAAVFALLVAVVAATALPASAAAVTPQPPGPTTMSWSVDPGTPKGAGAGTQTEEVCTGNFGQILREYDGSRYYIHFGGIQQCLPYPMEQDLQIFLYRWTVSGWVFADSAHAASPSAIMITAWHEPYCSSTTTTTYYMKAWGHANYVETKPYPASSPSYTIDCFHSA